MVRSQCETARQAGVGCTVQAGRYQGQSHKSHRQVALSTAWQGGACTSVQRKVGLSCWYRVICQKLCRTTLSRRHQSLYCVLLSPLCINVLPAAGACLPAAGAYAPRRSKHAEANEARRTRIVEKVNSEPERSSSHSFYLRSLL